MFNQGRFDAFTAAAEALEARANANLAETLSEERDGGILGEMSFYAQLEAAGRQFEAARRFRGRANGEVMKPTEEQLRDEGAID